MGTPLTHLIEDVWQDIRYAARSVSRARAFAIGMVLTLGIGFGAAVGVFAVINSTLINQLPYPEADRLVILGTDVSQYFSRPAFRRLRENPRGLELPAAAEAHEFVLTSTEMPERVRGHFVSADMITLLGLTTTNRPDIGRAFDATQPDSASDVLISHRAWVDRYQRDPAIPGRTVTLDGIPRNIVGVLGPRVTLFGESEFLLPLNLDGPNAYAEFTRTLEVFGRLPRGHDAADAEARLRTFFAGLRPVQRGHVEFVRDRVVHGFRATLLAMWLTTWLVLLVCCLNFATLLATRFWSRRPEFAVRVHLGATEGRLIRQLVTEGLVISVAGGVIGVVLASLAREILATTLTNGTFTSAVVTFDWKIAGSIAVMCGFVGVRFTLNAARQVSASSAVQVAAKPVMPRRRVTAAIQVAVATVLVCSSGALIQSLARLQAFDVGYRVDDAVTARFDLPPDTYPHQAAVAEFVTGVQRAVSAVPGVQRVSAASALPQSTTSRQLTPFLLEREPGYVIGPAEAMPPGWPPLPPPPPPPPGAPVGPPLVFHRALSFVTASDYFRTMGIRVLRGREFTAADTAASERVVVVNEAFARRYWANQDPLAQRVRLNPRSDWMTVVGVVGSIRRFSQDDQVRSEFYRPYTQTSEARIPFDVVFATPVNRVSFVVRTQLPATDVKDSIRRIVFAMDRTLPIAELSTLRDALDHRLQDRRRLLRLFVAISALTLIVAAIGIYGVTSYFVRQRLPELSVRAALGATRRQLIWLPIRDSVVVLVMGLPVGTLLAIGTAAQLRRIMPDVQPYEWSVLLVAGTVLVGCVLVAAYTAARRGADADPMVHIKSR